MIFSKHLITSMLFSDFGNILKLSSSFNDNQFFSKNAIVFLTENFDVTLSTKS